MNQELDNTMKFPENQQKIKFMTAALKQAKKADIENEVPVGAVVVYQGKIIARAHNKREQSQSFYAHAEFLAMIKATKKIGSWRLEDCDVYVTMEPCPMCAGAMIQARIRNLFYGVNDTKSGVAVSLTNIFELPFNHRIRVEQGLLADESREILKIFFKRLRQK